MAVDKNFVVRNGLEVNSDLIVTDTSDSSNKKVGIASTAPRVTLDVRGGIAATDLNVTGVATIATVDINAGDIEVSQIDATSINVAGITTLANVAITNINISGVATFADITYDEITGRNLNLTGIATIPSQANLNVTGIATIPTLNGITAFTDLNGTNATVGVATVTTANVTTLAGYPNFSSGATVAGVVTAAQFLGGGIGVGIKTAGGTVGFGFTTLNFIGSGNTFAVNGTTVDISIAGGGGGGGSASIGIGTTVGDAFSGIVTAGNLWYNTGEGRLFIYFQDATSAQWIDAAPFNVGIITTLQGQIDFSAGSASAPSITFNNDVDSGFFQAATNQPGVAAAGSQVARFNPGGVNVTGVVSATTFVGELNSSTLDTVDGGAVVTGVLTATSFSGDGSNLSNLPAGLGTALSSDNTSPLNKIYFTDQVLGVASTITIDPPSTAVVAYTQYADIQVTGDADLIIGDGDEFITDILGIGTTSVRANLGGSGGRVLADNYLDSSGTGAPTFPSGVNVTGVVTATTVSASNAVFDGNVTIGGTLTYQDVTNVDVLGIGTFQQGIQVLANGVDVTGFSTFKTGVSVTGVVTATSFSGNVTGNVTGNLTGDVNAATFDTGVGGVVVTGVATATTFKGELTGAAVTTSSAGLQASNVDFAGLLREQVSIASTNLSNQPNINLDNGMAHLFTGIETTTATPNIMSGTGINTDVQIGEAFSVSIIVSAAAAGYAATVHVDGVTVGTNGGSLVWNGGSAPSAGGASGNDYYTYNVIKTGDAAYTVLANVVNFA